MPKWNAYCGFYKCVWLLRALVSVRYDALWGYNGGRGTPAALAQRGKSLPKCSTFKSMTDAVNYPLTHKARVCIFLLQTLVHL